MSKKKQYYFIYDGKKVKTGTVLKIKPRRVGNFGNYVEEVIFEWYVPEIDLYVLRYRNVYSANGVGMYGNEFREYFICPMNMIDENVVRDHNMRMENNKLTLAKELHIDGMFIAWLWYVVLMGVTLIFNGRIFYWAFISLCFFVYRNTKLKREGYKE